MKTFYINLLIISTLFAQSEIEEVKKEIKRLQQLRDIVQKRLQKEESLLKKIEDEKTALQNLKKEIEKQIKEIKNKRFKKLAKDFENMDPEAAGEKLSKFKDPKTAAYIVYNMNSRKAGAILTYTDAKMVNKITTILTKIKKNEK